MNDKKYFYIAIEAPGDLEREFSLLCYDCAHVLPDMAHFDLFIDCLWESNAKENAPGLIQAMRDSGCVYTSRINVARINPQNVASLRLIEMGGGVLKIEA
jgi:hypothetical protein